MQCPGEGGMDAGFAQMVKEEYEQSREDRKKLRRSLKFFFCHVTITMIKT